MSTIETDFDIKSKTLQELNKLKKKLFKMGEERMNETIKKMVFELADGLKNTELLTELIAKRLTNIEGEVKVLDQEGNITILTLDDLKKEFATTPKYFGLIHGSKASGGMGSVSSNTSTIVSRKHSTPLMKLLEKTSDKYWENHDPNYPPKKDEVTTWLVKEEKAAKRIAIAIDAILRLPKFRAGGNRSRNPKR